MRAGRVLFFVVLFALLSPIVFAGNSDVGDVALVEDVNGDILSATATPNIWLQRAACAFYTTHGDYYDAIFFFNTNPANPMTNNQQGWTVRNPNKGIGRGDWDVSKNFCTTTKRLRITVSMGGISGLPLNPDDVAAIVPFYPLTGAELMGHEFGHHWLAAVNFDKGAGAGTECLLRGWEGSGETQPGDTLCSGYSMTGYNQHWSHYQNGCSIMYGSCIEDTGIGSDGKHHFLFSYPAAKYSQLDQYLMGLRTKEEVTEPIFVVDTGNGFTGSASIPSGHNSAPKDQTGTRIDVTIDDIIRANGPREPERDICHWKAAFVLVYAKGTKVPQMHIKAVDDYRKRWESFYPAVTDNLGSFDTTIYGCGKGTEKCPGKPSVICGTQPDGDEDLEEDTEAETPPTDGDTDADSADNEPVLDGDGESTTEPTDGDTSEAVDSDKDGTTEPPIDGDTTEAGEAGCTPGETRCMRNNPQKCSANGQAWLDTDDCAAAGKVCDSKTATCVSGTGGGGANGGCASFPGTVNGLLLVFFGLLAFWPKRMKLLNFSD